MLSFQSYVVTFSVQAGPEHCAPQRLRTVLGSHHQNAQTLRSSECFQKHTSMTFQVGTERMERGSLKCLNLNPSLIDVYVHCMVCNITIAYWEISTGRRNGEYPGWFINLASLLLQKVTSRGPNVTVKMHTGLSLPQSVFKIQHFLFFFFFLEELQSTGINKNKFGINPCHHTSVNSSSIKSDQGRQKETKSTRVHLCSYKPKGGMSFCCFFFFVVCFFHGVQLHAFLLASSQSHRLNLA